MKREERKDELFESLKPLIRGIGMALIELNVFHGQRKAGVQVKAVVMASGREAASQAETAGFSKDTSIDDCARAHRLLIPRLELAFPGKDISLEVSSPGIERLIKDGSEFEHFIGRKVRCYRTDISDWTAGILRGVDGEKIVLQADSGETILPYGTIAKARLSTMKNTGG